jgi:negative regulator of flagellin synthesis FlgM
MKISSPTDNPVAVSGNAASLVAKSGLAAAAQAKTSAVKNPTSAGVAVTVSKLAHAMETSGAEVDTAKVNSVRTAMAEGTYVVNPGVIADKLLSGAQEMLKRNRA